MSLKITPNNHEVLVKDNEFIVSKTDAKGLITYANRTFMRIVELPEIVLLGQPHNIIRHPDMPRGVFRMLWKTLQQGEEFFGLVKNLTADGSFYWVFANITADYASDGRLMGYYSVRVQPNREAVRFIEPVYRQMRQIETRAGHRDGPDAAVHWLQEQVAHFGFPDYETFVLHLNETGSPQRD